MSQHYSRRQKTSTEDKEPTPAKHIKKGFSAFQKTVALIGSILSIIVASITITNALKGSSATKPTDKSTTTVVIKGGNNSKTDTSASSAYSDDTDNDSGTVNNTYNDDANTTYSSSSDTTYNYSSDDSQSDSTQSSAATSDDTASSATEATE